MNGWTRPVSILAVAAAFTAFEVARAQTKPVPLNKDLVAVLDLDAIGASKAQAAGLSEQLRAELLNTGQYRLVDRAQMDKVLEEQALQQTGCTSQECAVQVGKILGVRKLIAGRVTKIEDTLWQVSAILVDVETAETLQAVTVNQDGIYRALLTTGIASLAAKLTGRSAGVAPVAAVLLAPAPANPLLRTFSGHSALVSSVAFSPDGRTALSASETFSEPGYPDWARSSAPLHI